MSAELDILNMLNLLLELYNHFTHLPVGIFYADSFNTLYSKKAEDEYPPFCKYVYSHPTLNKLCESDHVKRARNVNSPYFEYCHFGVANYKHPIYIDDPYVKNKHFGTILAGKRRINENKNIENEIFCNRLKEVNEKFNLTEEEKNTLIENFNDIQSIPEEIFTKNCQEAFEVLSHFFEKVILIYNQSLLLHDNKSMTIEILAHEILEPIIRIKNYSRLLQFRLDNQRIGDAQKTCNSIVDSIEIFRIYAETLREGVLNLEKDFIFKRENIYELVISCVKPFRKYARVDGLYIKPPIIEPREFFMQKFLKENLK